MSLNYKSIPIPNDLTFDEASLFWRLRRGEGIPTRLWHKPVDRTKTWHQVKNELDKKITSLFHKTFPKENLLSRLFSHCFQVLKHSFLID